ncbi:hypothetical protein GASC598I20_000090, partial [Gilliamella apicola SCGC AB-598-I20]
MLIFLTESVISSSLHSRLKISTTLSILPDSDFSIVLDKFGHLLVKDKILIVSGQVSHDDFNGGFKLSVR